MVRRVLRVKKTSTTSGETSATSRSTSTASCASGQVSIMSDQTSLASTTSDKTGSAIIITLNRFLFNVRV